MIGKKENRINTTGHCYHASEAFMYLTGGKNFWTPVVGKDNDNNTHWWLINKHDLKITDITRSQYYHLGKILPYNNGINRGFQQQSFSCLKLMKSILLEFSYNKNINQVISEIDLTLYRKNKNTLKLWLFFRVFLH